jgi:PBP1b-binding outer membrane lipoprotein LpoB
MKLYHFILLNALFFTGCAVSEPWTQRPPGCADTVRTIDAEGNPSFGPR